MIRTTMAFFGYIKIPVEAVQLSMAVEYFVKRVADQAQCNKPESKKYLMSIVESANTLTQFLRSGKLMT